MRELLGAESAESLSFATADLTADAGWADAVSGCDYVLHVASPFPLGPPKHEDDLIVPAREGALRVLAAARDARVKRVVMTSSFAAIGYGQAPPGRPFTEEDWTNPESDGLSAYTKSKTLAERAAWDFVDREGGGLELAVVNPVGVFGPVLGPDFSTSIELVQEPARRRDPRDPAGGVRDRRRARRRGPASARDGAACGCRRALPGDRGRLHERGRDRGAAARPHGRPRRARCRRACCPTGSSGRSRCSTPRSSRSSPSSARSSRRATRRRSECSAGPRARTRRRSSPPPRA